MAIKMRYLYASGKKKFVTIGDMVKKKFELTNNNAVDVIPPAYNCDKERFVFIGISVKDEPENKVRLFCQQLDKTKAAYVALIVDGNEKGANAVKDIVGVQFRNMATVGGSIWGRFGFSDVLTVFLALDSYVELYKGGIIPLEQFAGMKKDNDILVRLIVKKTPCKVVYTSMRNQRTDFPVLACAVSYMNGQYRASIGARPSRAMLVCNEKSEGFAAFVAENAPTEGNMRGSATYRTHLIRVLVERSMNELGGM